MYRAALLALATGAIGFTAIQIAHYTGHHTAEWPVVAITAGVQLHILMWQLDRRRRG